MKLAARFSAATKYLCCPTGNKLIAVGKLEERHPRKPTTKVPTLKASRSSSRLLTATHSGSEELFRFPWVSPTAINFLPFRQKKRPTGRHKTLSKKQEVATLFHREDTERTENYIKISVFSVSCLCALCVEIVDLRRPSR